MQTAFEELQTRLRAQPRTWLVTGVAGFIGSNLLETLLKLGQRVVGLDNFDTGYQRNLAEVQTLVTPAQWANFHFIEGDIRHLPDCQRAMLWAAPASLPPPLGEGWGGGSPNPPNSLPVDYVLHQAALGSVPRSIEDPITTNAANITGFLNMLVAARDAQVKSFTYAASSSTYGDHPGLPKVEDAIGKPLSPYAVTKYVNELYADVFARCYGFNTIGLRYFNVFGPRQDPNGAYAAVVPKWTAALLQGDTVYINGDGETSRDFCYVANAVQANLLAATAVIAGPPTVIAGTDPQSTPANVIAGADPQSTAPATVIAGPATVIAGADPQSTPANVIAGHDPQSISPLNQIYNVAVGDRTTLNQLFSLLRSNLAAHGVSPGVQPVYRDFRAGDVRHSQADVSKARRLLGYAPTHRLADGVAEAMPWYVK